MFQTPVKKRRACENKSDDKILSFSKKQKQNVMTQSPFCNVKKRLSASAMLEIYNTKPKCSVIQDKENLLSSSSSLLKTTYISFSAKKQKSFSLQQINPDETLSDFCELLNKYRYNGNGNNSNSNSSSSSSPFKKSIEQKKLVCYQTLASSPAKNQSDNNNNNNTIKTNTLTQDQQDAVDYICNMKRGQIAGIMAFAGCGKTATTAHTLNILKDKPILATLFQKQLAQILEERFREYKNLHVGTMHKIVRAVCVKWGFEFVADEETVKTRIHQMAGSQGYVISTDIVDHALIGLHRFFMSADKILSINHFIHITAASSYAIQNSLPSAESCFKAATKIWTWMQSKKVPLTFGPSLKLFHLRMHTMGERFVLCLVDEANDVFPVMLHIILNQKWAVVFIGDQKQEINHWNGICSVFNLVEFDRIFILRESFRVDKTIATTVNNFYELFSPMPRPMIGLNPQMNVLPHETDTEDCLERLCSMNYKNVSILDTTNKGLAYIVKDALNKTYPKNIKLVLTSTLIQFIQNVLLFWKMNETIFDQTYKTARENKDFEVVGKMDLARECKCSQDRFLYMKFEKLLEEQEQLQCCHNDTDDVDENGNEKKDKIAALHQKKQDGEEEEKKDNTLTVELWTVHTSKGHERECIYGTKSIDSLFCQALGVKTSDMKNHVSKNTMRKWRDDYNQNSYQYVTDESKGNIWYVFATRSNKTIIMPPISHAFHVLSNEII